MESDLKKVITYKLLISVPKHIYFCFVLFCLVFIQNLIIIFVLETFESSLMLDTR